MASVVRLDNLKSQYQGHIFSVKAPEALQNGQVGIVGDLLDGEREVRQLVKPATANLDKGLALIANPAIVYDESRSTSALEKNYTIAQDEVVRAYELHEKDIFSVSKDGIDLIGAEPVKGNYVVAQNASFKLKEVATVTGTEGFVGKIVRKDTIGTTVVTGQGGTIGGITEYIVIEVVKNVR